MVAPGVNNTVGTAVGRIAVDISALMAARDNAVRAGREISNALKGIGPAADQGTRQAEGSLRRLERRLDTIASKGSLAFTAFTLGGVKAAQSVAQLETKFRILAGSQEKANKEMAVLRQYASDTNQPFLKVLESASLLQTAIKGTKVDLKDITSIATRLSIRSPEQGPVGAGIALQEFLSGDYMSLTRRFEIDRRQLQQIMQEANGDVSKMVEGLDELLQQQGLTNDALAEMGEQQSFGLMADEIKQAMAVGFMPFLQDFLVPSLSLLREFLQYVRDVNPELLKMASTAAAIVAATSVAKRGVPMLGVPGLPGAGGISPTRAVVGAGALYGGVQLGTQIARRLPGSEVEGKSQEEAMNIIGERFKQVIGIFISGLANAAKLLVLVKTGLEIFAAGVEGVLNKFVAGVEYLVGSLLNFVDDLPGLSAPRTSEETLRWARNRMSGPVISEERRQEIGDNLVGAFESIDNITKGAFDALGLIDKVGGGFNAFLKGAVNLLEQQTVTPEIFSEQQVEAFGEFQDRLAEIEADAQEQREDALEQHEKTKTDIEEDYNRRLQRMDEDEERRRIRAVADRDKAISKLLANSTDKETDIYARHRDRLSKLDADFHNNQTKAQTDHQRKMSRMQRDFDLERQKAAARLDFQALYEMKERQRIQKDDAQSDFDYRQQQRQAQYDEALAQEQAALEERLKVNQQAEADRIQQIRDTFKAQEALRAEDRQLQLERMEEDHQLQLSKLDEQQQERLAQIDEQAQQKADLENQAFIELFNNLAVEAGQHQNRMLNIQREGQQNLEAELTAWWSRQNRVLTLGSRGVSTQQHAGRMGGYQDINPPRTSAFGATFQNIYGGGGSQSASGGGYYRTNHTPQMSIDAFNQRNRYMGNQQSWWDTYGGRAIGGDIPQTGPYNLHKGEFVMRPEVAAQVQRMMGGAITQHGMMAAMSGGGGNNLTMGDFAPNMNFGDIGNYSPEEIAEIASRAFRSEFSKLLKGFVA